MFAARTAAEIFATNQDFAGIRWHVQDKISFGRIVVVITPIAEEVIAKSFAFSGFQEAGRDNLVSINVLIWHGNGTATEYGEFFVRHFFNNV